METSDQKAVRLDAERVEEQMSDLEAAQAFAAAPQLGPAAVDQYTGPRKQPNYQTQVVKRAL
jgi:hypothetical protein